MIQRFTNTLIENKQISKQDRDLYEYGLKEGLMLLGNIATTIIIGILFGMWWQSIVFIIVYSPLRSFAGGAHAKTHLRCYLLSVLLTVAVLLLIMMIPFNLILYLGLALVAAVIIFTLAPVEDKNKPLDQIEIRVYKRRTRIILAIECSLNIFLIVAGRYEIASCIVASNLALAVMLVIGKVENHYLT